MYFSKHSFFLLLNKKDSFHYDDFQTVLVQHFCRLILKTSRIGKYYENLKPSHQTVTKDTINNHVQSAIRY